MQSSPGERMRIVGTELVLPIAVRQSAEAGGPRRFDPWVRGVWLVNRRVTHPLPPLRGRGGGPPRGEGGGGGQEAQLGG